MPDIEYSASHRAARPLLFLTLAVLLLLAALATLHAGTQSPARAAGEIQGDVDCSGAADSIDALKVLLSVSSLPYSADCLEAAGDVDCSGARDSIDALRILGDVAGLPFTPPAGCVPIGDPLIDPDAPTGEELIDAALAAGQIDQDTAVLYKAYWAFQDPRLPEQFDGPAHGGDVPHEIWLRPDGLSPETEAQLARYLLPPSAPESWYYNSGTAAKPFALPLGPSLTPTATAGSSPSATATPLTTPPTPVITWMPITSASGRIKVWWDSARPEDQAKAQTLVSEVEAVWDAYDALLGVEPLGDGDIPTQYNGGDATYDAYLAPLAGGLYGFVAPYHDILLSAKPCPSASTFMVLNTSNSAVDQSATLAHELFHSFQFATTDADSCANVRWIWESTAAWAEDYIYPQANTEHIFQRWPSTHWQEIQRWHEPEGYSAWPFWLYIAHTDSPQVIGDIFEALKTQKVENAIDGAVDGGLKERWPEFALYLWNHAPVAYLKQWDQIDIMPWYRTLANYEPNAAAVPDQLALATGETIHEYTVTDPEVNGLAMGYYHFLVGAAGAGTKDPAYVQINNPWGGATPDRANVQIAYAIGGTWETADLTEETGKAFCLEDEAVTEIIVIVSNSALVPSQLTPPFTKPLAVARDSCGWTGNATVTYFDDSTGIDTLVTGTATDLFFVAEGAPAGPTPNAGTTYKLAGGTLTWTYRPETYIEYGTGGAMYHCERTMAPLTVELGEADGEMLAGPTTGGGFNFRLLGAKPGQLTGMHQCEEGGYSYPIGVDLSFPWLCGEGSVGPGTESVEGMEHYITTEDVHPRPPIECPAQAPQGQEDVGVHAQDFVALTVDWEFHLEK